MWRFCDRSTRVLLGVLIAAHGGIARSLEADALTAKGIHDETTAGRKLLKAALPPYPVEEHGRWTQSCVSLYFTVRPDGKPDQFVVLQSSRPRASSAAANGPTGGDERKFDNLPLSEQQQEAREMWLFVQPSVKALYRWEYAPAAGASDEIAVFRFERSEMGGHVMKISARRLDLGTADPSACSHIDPADVRKLVAKARGH